MQFQSRDFAGEEDTLSCPGGLLVPVASGVIGTASLSRERRSTGESIMDFGTASPAGAGLVLPRESHGSSTGQSSRYRSSSGSGMSALSSPGAMSLSRDRLSRPDSGAQSGSRHSHDPSGSVANPPFNVRPSLQGLPGSGMKRGSLLSSRRISAYPVASARMSLCATQPGVVHPGSSDLNEDTDD